MSNQVIYIIKAVDRATAPLRRVAGATRTMTRGLLTAGAAMKKMGYHFTSLRGIISATYGAAMIAFPIKKAIDFEDKMVDIKRILTFKSDDAFAKFREGLIQTGLHLGKLPKEMAAIGYEIAKFISDPKMVKGYVDLAAKVSRSFDIPGREASEQIGKISAKMGLNLQGMEKFLDAVNYASDRSATTVKNQLQIIARVSTNMKGVKLPPNLAAGWANFADQISATPRIAAKGLEMFFRDVSKMRGGYRKIFKPGQDTNKVFVEFLEKLKKMPEVSRRMRLDRMFPTRTANIINKMVERMDLLYKSLGLVGENSKFAGSMQRELEKKLSTARTAMDRVRAVLDVVAITIGNAFLPLIKELSPMIIGLALSFREFVRNHPTLIKVVMGVIALVTVLTGATIVVGLLAIAFGTLMSPVTLIVLGIMALVAGITYLYTKSEGVRTAFSAMLEPLKIIWNQVDRIFTKLFGGDTGAVFGGVFKVLETVAIGVLEALGMAFNLILSPIWAVLAAVELVVDVFVKLGEIWATVSGFFGEVMTAMGKGAEYAAASGYGMSGSIPSPTAGAAGNNQTSLNGQIDIGLSKELEAKKSNLDSSASGNLGFSMRGL